LVTTVARDDAGDTNGFTAAGTVPELHRIPF